MATVKAYRCMRTGLYYPGDYVEEWGTKYGVGLGPVPVSEALVNIYALKPAVSAGGKETYTAGHCRAAIQHVEIEDTEYDAGRAVLMADDPSMSARAAIMRARQVAHGRVAE